MADFDPYDLTNLEEGHKRYLITDDEGEFTVDVPETWKVTYGRLHAGGQGWDGGRRTGNYLRFYEAENKQRAIFANVKNFRDMSIRTHRIPTDEELQVMADDFIARANRRENTGRPGTTLREVMRRGGIRFEQDADIIVETRDARELDADWGPEDAEEDQDVPVNRIEDMPF